MMRRRVLLALTLLVGLIILILAYSGIESSRDNMLQLIKQGGESMMQALVTSAGNNLAASAIVEEAGAQRLLEIGSLLGRLLDSNPRLIDTLEYWERRYQLNRIDVIRDDSIVAASSWSETAGKPLVFEPDRMAVLDSVISGGNSVAIAAPLPSALPIEDLVYLAVATRSGVLLLEAPARRLTDYQESLGIGYVVRQMGGQDAISYVVLQTDSGIVLASRAIAPMVAIEDDPFVSAALGHEQTVTRLHDFEGKEVLEVVRSFKTDVMPSGVFRLGMSLDVYHQLYIDSLKQLGILSLVLFALGIVGAYATTKIKKLHVTEGSLEQLRSMTDEIVQSLEAAVVATDRSGNLTIFNPQAERIFAKSARALLGRSYKELFPADEIALQRIKSDPAQVFRGEIVLPHSDSERLHLLVSTSPLYDRSGAFNGGVSLVYDLTEMKRLEESARSAERLSELGTLAAGVAHEIRNPLNSIAIAAQRLQLEFTPADNIEEYRAFLKTIASEIERLNSIIKDFLSLARGGKLNKVLVDLNAYFDEIIALAKLETEK
ncbi:MAG: histidine kinase dimerization/phospho-acceptor domain-containing protein, partial [Candidatus Zixiibacteriota bacterium]